MCYNKAMNLRKDFLALAMLTALSATAVPTPAEIAMRHALNAISNNLDSTTITNLPPLERKELPQMTPQLIAGDEYFYGSTRVIFAYPEDGSRVHYTLDGTQPDSSSPVYKGNLVLTDTTRIRAAKVYKDGSTSPDFNMIFHQVGLRNGDFEKGNDMPEFWGPSGGARAVYEKDAGMGGSRCISLQSDDLTSAVWSQKISVKPFTPYILKGYIRLSGVTGDSEYCLATIGGNFNAKSETGPPVGGDPNAGWQEFKVDVLTGNTHEATVVCRLGDLDGEDNQGGFSKGKVYFDNLTFEENKEVTTFRGKTVVMPLYKHIIDKVGGANVCRAMVRNLEKALVAMKDLTGWAPQGPADTFAIWTPRYWSIRAGGWSGNPILVVEGFYSINWRHALDNMVSGVFIHESGHNYNNSLWSPGAHEYTHALLQMYAINGAGLTVDEGKWAGTKPNGHTWFLGRAEEEKRQGFPMSPWQYAMKLWEMGEKLGWDATKKTFRDFHQIEHPPLTTPLKKIEYYLDRLSVHSGHDVRKEFFTEEQIEYFRQLHAERPDPVSLDQFDVDVTNVYLTYTKWTLARNKTLDPPERCSVATRETIFQESLNAPAPSYYIFNIPNGWYKLEGYYGLQRGKKGKVKFVIYGDDKQIWSSSSKSDTAHSFSVNIKGVQVLRLETVNVGEENNPKAYWMDLHVIRDGILETKKDPNKKSIKAPMYKPPSKSGKEYLEHQ